MSLSKSIKKEFRNIPNMAFFIILSGLTLIIIALINIFYVNTIGSWSYMLIIIGICFTTFAIWMYERAHLNLRYEELRQQENERQLNWD